MWKMVQIEFDEGKGTTCSTTDTVLRVAEEAARHYSV